jgi:hypothetical protein
VRPCSPRAEVAEKARKPGPWTNREGSSADRKSRSPDRRPLASACPTLGVSPPLLRRPVRVTIWNHVALSWRDSCITTMKNEDRWRALADASHTPDVNNAPRGKRGVAPAPGLSVGSGVTVTGPQVGRPPAKAVPASSCKAFGRVKIVVSLLVWLRELTRDPGVGLAVPAAQRRRWGPSKGDHMSSSSSVHCDRERQSQPAWRVGSC